ncbi:MAG TPA: DUF6527 family protein [Terriglobales bacterium]
MTKTLEHQFVEFIPEVLDGGVPYISVKYATAVHKCCCGCSREVVTPLSPTFWHMTFDGEMIVAGKRSTTDEVEASGVFVRIRDRGRRDRALVGPESRNRGWR